MEIKPSGNTGENLLVHVDLLPSSLLGVQAMRISSKRSFDKHWHGTFGFGVMEQGGHRSASGRGQVEVVAGSVLTHNPGEVHDGVPLAGEVRRWIMLQVDANLMRSLGGQTDERSDTEVEFTHPVLQDPQLAEQLQRLCKVWSQRDTYERDDGLTRLADESALSLLCTRMLAQHSPPPIECP